MSCWPAATAPSPADATRGGHTTPRASRGSARCRRQDVQCCRLLRGDVQPMTTPREQVQEIQRRVNASVIGQERVVERLVIALLADGNVLVENQARVWRQDARHQEPVGGARIRVQSHPFDADLLPFDVDRRRIYSSRRRRRGHLPVQAGADLRQPRAGRRDQSRAGQGPVGAARGHGGAAGHGVGQALQAAGLSMVLATQNPIEQEGTYPLPEAQMDLAF